MAPKYREPKICCDETFTLDPRVAEHRIVLKAKILAAEMAANRAARSRRLEIRGEELEAAAAEVVSAPVYGGDDMFVGPIITDDAYTPASQVSVVWYLWCPRVDGLVECRVVGARMNCSSVWFNPVAPRFTKQDDFFAMGFEFLFIDADFLSLFVYHGKRSPGQFRSANTADWAFRKNINDRPWDVTTWMVYADWLEEHGGRPEFAARIRALVPAARIDISEIPWAVAAEKAIASGRTDY